MNFVRCRHTLSNRGLRYPAHLDVPHLPAKKPLPTGGDTLAKKHKFRPIPSSDRTIQDWTAIAWPTNTQSGTSDGKFGPAKQMKGWGDCWFLTSLAAVANDPEGRKILAESIKRVNGGYYVTFAGSPITKVFIADIELQELLATAGGDADTRIMELAAERFFQLRGNFQDLCLAAIMKEGHNQSQAKRCFEQYCRKYSIQDPVHFNPMHGHGSSHIAFFLLTAMCPAFLLGDNSNAMQRSDVMRFLDRFVTNGRDGTSVLLSGATNPLGVVRNAQWLVLAWDVIRTEITRDKRLRKKERAFLNALHKWLKTGNSYDFRSLRTAAGNLNLVHINPVDFVDVLVNNQFDLTQDHFDLLRSAVREVLGGGPGYIGFAGNHYGNIEGINEAAGTFTYSEPSFPTLVYTGELSVLIQAIRSGDAALSAIEPITKRYDGEHFEHASTSRGRHLRQIHNRVVRDGTIDQAESGPLANLMNMDDGTFWQEYDSDKNGMIEGGELKAVQLRVDRWVDNFELSPIW